MSGFKIQVTNKLLQTGMHKTESTPEYADLRLDGETGAALYTAVEMGGDPGQSSGPPQGNSAGFTIRPDLGAARTQPQPAPPRGGGFNIRSNIYSQEDFL